MKRAFLGLVFLMNAMFVTSQARADWTLNIGYHNPVYSQLGVNFLYWGSQWNFEAGIGWIDADADADADKGKGDKDDNHLSASLAGDINLKYRLTSGSVAPYIQAGFGAAAGASVGDRSGADADLGGPFAGLGVFFGKPTFHVYVAGNYLIDPKETQVQAGLGFDI